MEMFDFSMYLFILFNTYPTTYACENATDKSLIHISSISQELYGDCVGNDFIQSFIDSFLEALHFHHHPANDANFGACMSQCIQQANCSALVYDVTDGCYVSLQGAESSPGSAHHQAGFSSNIYIDKDSLQAHIAYFNTAQSELSFSWCNEATQDVFVGDFNGDGVDDLLCHQRRAGGGVLWPQGTVSIAYNRPGIGFGQSGDGSNTWESEMNWCDGSNHELYIADFNGDGRDDMLCNHNGTDNKLIAFATPDGTFNDDPSWQGLPTWCHGGSFFNGDFNGDGRHDLLCKNLDNAPNGNMWIALATLDGTFDANYPSTTSHEANWCFSSDDEPELQLLTTGDFNGDGRNDLLCRRPLQNKIRISLMEIDGSFGGHHWGQTNGFCYLASEKLIFVDVNGDDLSDMMCIDIATGYTRIVLALEGPAVQFGGIVWENEAFCRGENARLLVGNFDGDEKTDVLCKTTNTLCYTTSH